MIQRIQTIYLLIATIITIIVVCMPLGTLTTSDYLLTYGTFFVRYDVPAPGNTAVCSTAYIGLFLILVAILSCVTLFLYKNRKRQIALISINMIILLIALMLIVYIYPEIILPRKQIIASEMAVHYNYWFLIIVIPAIMLYLAKRAIIKDEARVRAADRLR